MVGSESIRYNETNIQSTRFGVTDSQLTGSFFSQRQPKSALAQGSEA
jgi:hypothetical protein